MKRETTARRQYFWLAICALPGVFFWAHRLVYFLTPPVPYDQAMTGWDWLGVFVIGVFMPLIGVPLGVVAVAALRRTSLAVRLGVLAIDAAPIVWLIVFIDWQKVICAE